jgi:hypothetical protein
MPLQKKQNGKRKSSTKATQEHQRLDRSVFEQTQRDDRYDT